MKNFNTFIFLLLLFSACKTDKKETPITTETTQTTAEKIAFAHGIENWKNVSDIEFTFNVDKDSSHFERSWTWNPKTDDVLLISEKDTVSYNRKSVDSTSIEADKSFINDKYWLLAPFQLIWDEGTTFSEPVKEQTPISGEALNKITLNYSNNGGYTPGDAYDFYYGDDYLIKEWVFRKGNSEKPSLITTWENYQDVNDMKISLNHIKPDENWKLYFTNLKIKLN